MRHDGRGNKADYCPPERGLVLGHRGTRSQPFKCMNGWMDGWTTVWVDAGPPPSDTPAILPAHREGMRGNQGRSGGMQGIVGEQSWLLSPRERSCAGLQGKRSQPLWDGKMDEYMTSLPSDGQKKGDTGGLSQYHVHNGGPL